LKGTIEVSEKAGNDFTGWVKRELDELRVQVHLGKAEMGGRWERLERTFETLEGKAKQTSRAAEKPLRQIDRASDLRDGYRQIRDAL
jgi:hypothetical protein